jgi:hypothetical protein
MDSLALALSKSWHFLQFILSAEILKSSANEALEDNGKLFPGLEVNLS